MRWLTLTLVAAALAACAGSPPPRPTASAPNTTVNNSGAVALDSSAQATAAPVTAIPANPEAVPDVVATVNGEAIPREVFERTLARRQIAVNAADTTTLENFVLTSMINHILTRQAADRMNITVTEAEVEAELAELRSLAGTDAAWQDWLAQNLYTEEELIQDLYDELLTAKVRDEVVKDVVDESQRQVHARHILVNTEAEALQIRTRLLNGERFVDLAAQYSNDVTTRNEGGDLGWFTPEELLEPRVAEVAFNQPEGAISQPVGTRLGYHIIETLGFDDLPLPEDKRAQVTQAVFEEWLAAQNDSAIIEIFR